MEIDLRKRLPAVALCFLLACVGLIETQVHLDLTGPGWDARAYWNAWQGAMYDGSVGDPGHYLYSPVFAQLVWPLTHLPWPAFAGFFIAVNAVGLAWLLRPLPLTLAVPLWLAGSQEVMSGNVFIPMAVVAVLGLRLPHLWAFVALTKITPCLGPVWFAARGEWSALARVVATTTGLVVVSALVAPDLWRDWIGFLVDQARISDGAVGYEFIPGPLYRLPVAVLLVVWAARTDRVWVLPVAMVLATPFIWNGSFTLLAAIPRLTAAARGVDPGAPGAPVVRSADREDTGSA
ncbi:glycosyltransferase family 87 protein [Nocardioides sp.]|uniref:glycosyltransferase family 87 protein n=1 Tax=Nocardioides sp. TaxID=35761 RepID=UPI0035B33D19